MTAYEDRCVGSTDLGLHCQGSSCSNKNVKIHYCDECNSDGCVVVIDDEELCESCAETTVDNIWNQLSLNEKLELLTNQDGYIEYSYIEN